MVNTEDKDEPGTRHTRLCDRLAAQKSRAQARQGQVQAVTTPETCGIAPSVTGRAEAGTEKIARRKQFANVQRTGIDLLYSNVAEVEKTTPLSVQKSTNDYAVAVVSDDALSQFVKEAETSGGHMLRGDALEARRRAVPGLCPSDPPTPRPKVPQLGKGTQATMQGNLRSGYNASSQSVTHGMPSEGRGGSNLWARGNAGNMVTDRPTSRVIKPPGGGSSFRIGKW